MTYELIRTKKATYPVTLLCKTLDVSTSAFYQWLCKPDPTDDGNEQSEALKLRIHIRAIFKESDGTYGRPRITRMLRKQGFAVNEKRVERIMREEGLYARPKPRFKKTTTTEPTHPVAENLLNRDFEPKQPNQVFVGDITYIPLTGGGFAYLSVLIDLFSRKVVGWCVSEDLRTELCLTALSRAVSARRPAPGWMHHSDRGCQYTSSAYRQQLDEHGAIASMSRKGNCWDNAVAESFFGSAKLERFNADRYSSVREVRESARKYIQYYNQRRLHSHNDYLSPDTFEQRFREKQKENQSFTVGAVGTVENTTCFPRTVSRREAAGHGPVVSIARTHADAAK